MKSPIRRLLILSILVCSFALLLQRCGKDDEVIPPPPSPTDTLAAGWQKIYVDTSTFLLDINFPTQQIGFVCGNRVIAKSINGGLTWTKLNLPDSLIGHFSFLFFLNENTGWVTSSTYILRTTDGGTTWKKTNLESPADIQFLNSTIGYVATSNGLFKSIDGGASFQKIVGAGSEQYTGVFFFDENNGWVTGSGFVQATQNGGSSFSKRTDIPLGNYYNVRFTDANNGWLSGSLINEIWFTKNAGANWDKVSISPPASDVHFLNNTDGYISSTHEIYRTANGGATLTRDVFTVTHDIVEIHFTDPNHGWATSGGYIYRYSK